MPALELPPLTPDHRRAWADWCDRAAAVYTRAATRWTGFDDGRCGRYHGAAEAYRQLATLLRVHATTTPPPEILAE